MVKRSGFAIAGFAYGLVLTGFGFVLAGAGHGSYTLIGLVSAPLGLINAAAAFFLTPFFWCFMFALASSRQENGQRWLLVILLCHYIAAIFLLALNEQYGDWAILNRNWFQVRTFVLLALTFYVLGQVILWRIYLLKRKPKTAA